MNRFINRRALLVGGLAMVLGVGIISLATAHDDDTEPKPKDGPATFVDPDKGLSDDEIRQKDREMIERQREKNRDFVADFQKQQKDPRPLHRAHIMSEPEWIPANIEEAAEAATLIVRAEVQSVRFEHEVAVSELKVSEILKGGPAKSLTLVQGGGPRFDDPSGKAILIEEPWDPILLKGDEAVLFLRPDPTNADRYVTVPAQNYLVQAGVISVPEESQQFQFAGMPVATLLEAIVAAIQ